MESCTVLYFQEKSGTIGAAFFSQLCNYLALTYFWYPLWKCWVFWVGKIPWRRERLPTPGFWPGELHGLYSPWGCKESDTTEWHSRQTKSKPSCKDPEHWKRDCCKVLWVPFLCLPNSLWKDFKELQDFFQSSFLIDLVKHFFSSEVNLRQSN